MAAVITYPSRLGENSLTGADPLELFMKEFSGMVMTEFNELNVFRSKHRVKVINSGESHTFEALGTATSIYHIPGDNILESNDGGGSATYLNEIAHGRRTILTDPIEVAPVFVSDWDEFVNHYEVRGEYARQLGEALAESDDRRLGIVACLTARETATYTNGPGGGSVSGDVNIGTDSDAVVAAAFVNMAFEARDIMNIKKVPKAGRFLAVSTTMLSILIKENAANSILIDKDLSSGNGDVAMATIYKIAGFTLVETEHVPSTDITSSPVGARNTYHGDFSKTVGVAFRMDAFGSTQLKGLSSSVSYKDEYLGHLLMSKMCVGSGPLRPECAVEFVDNTP